MIITRYIEMDFGDVLDGDAAVTADVNDGRCEIKSVIAMFGDTYVDLVNEITEATRERITSRMLWEADHS